MATEPGLVDLDRLREARMQVHYALQWLARAARAFVPPQPHDTHTNLGWDDALNGFVTHPMKGDLQLGLGITELTLVLATPSVDVSFTLANRTDSDARVRLGELLAAYDLDPARAGRWLVRSKAGRPHWRWAGPSRDWRHRRRWQRRHRRGQPQ